MNQLIGRLVYNTPLGALGNITSLASIVSMESTFKFQFITPPIETKTGGDGMTFFISPARSIPANSSGGGLGIVNEATGNATDSSLHLFAVEFDTFKNRRFKDPNNNHVGIDINSLISVVTASIGPDPSLQSDLDLYSNSSFLVWVDYYSANLSIEVRMITAETTSSSSPSSSFSDVVRPPDPLLILTRNLSALLGDPGLDMFVGLSATTGTNFQGCAIYSWDFALTVVQPAVGAAEPATTGSSNVLRKLLIPAIIAVAVFVVGFIVAVLAYRKRRRRSSSAPQHGANDDDDPHVQELALIRRDSLRNRHYNLVAGPATTSDALTKELPSITHKTIVPAALTQYKFEELHEATQGFHKSAKLGEGGYSSVYKGELLMPSSKGEANLLSSSSSTTTTTSRKRGESVAVKRLNRKGLNDTDKFFHEINEIYGLRHERLVELVGWCYDKKHGAMLVYELMSNGSLSEHLFPHKRKSSDHEYAAVAAMSSVKRVGILKDVAEALVHLHANGAVHRDVKPPNVLLGPRMEAKLGDFGLLRLLKDDHGNTWSTDPAGTKGHMAPEVAVDQTRHLSDKMDVYSFGVLVLELASGRRVVEVVPGTQQTLLDWVRSMHGIAESRTVLDSRMCQADADLVTTNGVEGSSVQAAEAVYNSLADMWCDILGDALRCCAREPQERPGRQCSTCSMSFRHT